MKFTTKRSCPTPGLRMPTEESRLNLAHQNLRTVPKTLVNSYQSSVTIIDISNNNINDVSFLSSFTNLSCIILDHNELTSETVFPFLPSVRILWANHNHIQGMGCFLRALAESFPRLSQLSLMGNPGVPLCHEDTYYQYLRYRLYTISLFGELEHLDDRPVTEHEKAEARRLFGNSAIFEKVSSITSVFSDAMNKVLQYVAPPPSSSRPSNIVI